MDAAVPGWAFAFSFIGGPILLLIGAIVGMRYGHFERYHKDYDPETGTIDSNHPFARLQERVSLPIEGEPADGDHPEKFVMNRTHLVAFVSLLVGGPFVYLYVSLDFSPMLRSIVLITLGGGGIVSFIITDRILQQEEMGYQPRW